MKPTVCSTKQCKSPGTKQIDVVRGLFERRYTIQGKGACISQDAQPPPRKEILAPFIHLPYRKFNTILDDWSCPRVDSGGARGQG